MPYCPFCGVMTEGEALVCAACTRADPALAAMVTAEAEGLPRADASALPLPPRPDAEHAPTGLALDAAVASLQFRFLGVATELLKLYLITFLLSTVTLGVYSFWGRARIRKYIWNSIEFEGHTFDFHGTGWELMTGFIKAAIFFVLMVGQSVALQFVLGEERGGIVGALIIYLAIALVLPVVIVGAQRYRLSRTSFRGIRFSFRGRVRELMGVHFKGLLLMVVTLGIATPIWWNNIRQYLTNHSYYGNARFEFDGDGGDLIGKFFLSRLLLLPSLGVSYFWYFVVRFRHMCRHTTFQGARFHTDVATGPVIWLGLTNLLATVFTLGLAIGWARCRYYRYLTSHLFLRGVISLESIQQFAQSATASGEAVTALLDVEGFDLGF